MVFSLDNICTTICAVLSFLMIITQPLHSVDVLDSNHTTIALYLGEILDTRKTLGTNPNPPQQPMGLIHFITLLLL